MVTLDLTVDEREFLVKVLDSVVADSTAALRARERTWKTQNTTNVALLLEVWRSQAADLRERLHVENR